MTVGVVKRRQGRALLCSAAGKSKSFLLADIGEGPLQAVELAAGVSGGGGIGIAEVEVLQWYITEGQEVSMFDKVRHTLGEGRVQLQRHRVRG